MTPCSRRCFLTAALRTGVGVSAAGLLVAAGCGKADGESGDRTLRLSLAEVPEGRRVRVMVGSVPAEILRDNGTVTARSLLCTHQGCTVIWAEDTARYVCPCHDGAFDARGNPIYGPPRRPLRVLHAEIVDGQVEITA